MTYIVRERMGNDVVSNYETARRDLQHIKKADIVLFFTVNQSEIDLSKPWQHYTGVATDIFDEVSVNSC